MFTYYVSWDGTKFILHELKPIYFSFSFEAKNIREAQEKLFEMVTL